MGEYHIGRLIKGFRESKRILQKDLYYGLKWEGEIYKIEGGDQEVSKLLVDILLERMGLSTDMYGYVFSIKEYELFQCRADLLELLENGQWEEAETLCAEYEKKAPKKDKFQNQYIRTIKLLITIEKGASPDYLLKEAEEILFLTVPKFKIKNIREFLLSGMERMLVAIQAEALCSIKGREEEGMELYYNLLFYMEENCTDFLEQERQMPPLILLMVRWLWKWERYSEIWICQKGIEVLRNNMRLSLLEPLMKYEMKAWERGLTIPEGENIKEWKAGLEALEEIRKEYNMKEKYRGEYKESTLFALMIRQNVRGQILGDTIRRIRKEKGLSVEQLAENICEPENLRKIELGKMKPRQKTYSKIMKKLGQEKYAYYPMICSDDYRMYESCQEVKKYIYKFEFEKAEYELKRLEQGLDCQYKVNEQTILKFRGVLKERLKQISLEEKLNYFKKALEVTTPKETDLKNWSLNREEIILWSNIASTMEEMGNREEAISILQSIKKSYEQNTVKLWNYKQEYMMILSNLSTSLEHEKRYKEAIEITNYAIPLSLEWKQGNYLATLLYNKIWIIEKLMKEQKDNKEAIEKQCFPILKQNFSIASIIQYTSLKRYIEKHCKDYYGILIEELF